MSAEDLSRRLRPARSGGDALGRAGHLRVVSAAEIHASASGKPWDAGLVLRPDQPHTPADDELAAAARDAMGADGDADPAALVRDALAAAGGVFSAHDWLYEFMVPPLIGLATERSVAAGLRVLDRAMEPASYLEHQALRDVAAQQAIVHFESHRTVIDMLDSDLDDAIRHGARSALHRHLQNRSATGHAAKQPHDDGHPAR